MLYCTTVRHIVLDYLLLHVTEPCCKIKIITSLSAGFAECYLGTLLRTQKPKAKGSSIWLQAAECPGMSQGGTLHTQHLAVLP